VFPLAFKANRNGAVRVRVAGKIAKGY